MVTTQGNAGIKVLLVDDDAQVRGAIRTVLERVGGFQIAEAEDGMGALREFTSDRPDVVLLDLRMPRVGGIETMERLAYEDPGVPIVILTAYGDVPTAVDAIKGGAFDFIEKPPDIDKLTAILRRAAETRGRKTEQEIAYSSLTSREREILRLTAEGLSSTMIAERLFISHRTVETHRAHVMKKLGAKNKSELILLAFSHGILPPEKR